MLKTLKETLLQQFKNAAKRRQYHLVPEWKLGNYPLALHLRRLFELQRIDCVLDVGGNLGQYHDLLREDVGYRGWIISFEPVQKYIRHLQQRAASDSRWIIMDCALGAAAGTAQIHVTQSPGLNSFLSPSCAALPRFWEGQETRSETVRIEKLDDLLPGLQIRTAFNNLYLKLDTQGFDLEVIKGAPQSLQQMRALQIEASVQPIYEGMPHWKESVQTLEEQGFDLSAMFPVLQDDALRLVEFDCVMLNRRFIEQ